MQVHRLPLHFDRSVRLSKRGGCEDCGERGKRGFLSRRGRRERRGDGSDFLLFLEV